MTQRPAPPVSVVMAVRNGMPYLPETMASLSGQTFRDYEVVLVDDASTDGTAEYVRGLADPRLVYLRREEPAAPPARNLDRLVDALNAGLAAARGRYVARLDGDDVCLPTRLADQFARLEADPGLVLLGCDFDLIDPAGERLGDNPYNVTADAAYRWLLLFDCPFLQPGVMLPRDAVAAVGGYRRVTCAEDYDLWVRLAAHGRVGALPGRLMRKRQHPNNTSLHFRAEGFTTTAGLAAGYAAALAPGVDPAAARRLYALYHGLYAEVGPSPAGLLATLRHLERAFAAAHSVASDSEAARAVNYVRATLGYRAFQTARANKRRPLRAAAWARAAAAFDPSRYAPVRLAARALRLAAPRPVPTRVLPG